MSVHAHRLLLPLLAALSLESALSLRSHAAPPAPQPQAQSEPRRDRYGDPLPPGAIARLGTLRFRMDAERVLELAFALDGKTLAVASPRSLRLFDAATGKQAQSFYLPNIEWIYQIAFSPDGKRLMLSALTGKGASMKGIVQIRDISSGRKISEKDLNNVRGLSWEAERQPMAACWSETEITVHEIATERKRHFPIKGLPDPLPFWWAMRKNLLAAGGNKGVIHVWDLASGTERWAFNSGGAYLRNLSLSPDGRWLAAMITGLRNHPMKPCVKLWDLTTGKAIHTIPGNPWSAVFTPDNKTLATVEWGEVRFWDVASGRERGRTKRKDRSFVPSVSFTPDGKTMATAETFGGAIHLWDVATGEAKPEPEGHISRPGRPAFSPDGRRVATAGYLDNTIRVWDVATGASLARIHGAKWVRDVAFSADGRKLYSCWADGNLCFDDAASGRRKRTLKVEDPNRPKEWQSGSSLHLSDDRKRLIIFSTNDCREMLATGWDTATGKQLFHRRRIDDTYWSAVSADARTLATAAGAWEIGKNTREIMGAGPLRLEDLASGERLLTFPSSEGQTWPLTFSSDGRLLISYTHRPRKEGEPEGALRLWEVLTASELLILPAGYDTSDASSELFFHPIVNRMQLPLPSGNAKPAVSPDGRLLAAAAASGEIILWDLFKGKERHRFKGFNARASSLAFSPDGRRLISGLSDSTLLVWDVEALAPPPAGKLGAEGAAKAWADLAAKDASRAFRARGVLASAAEDALALLKERLHSAKAADPQRLRRLLADLESEQFAIREKAQEELEKLGDLAESALRQTLANKPALEVRRRVQAVLERLRGPVTRPELLQTLRAVAVLEDIGTAEARRVLEQLAKGAAEARLTREAKASLQRLEKKVYPPADGGT